ncbi:MAG: sulfite exporter TauE/SafE family protein [Bacteroidales bacterium]|nr:sulfite exporter TauE/SafE family protein [Bacteroidales bacterium]MBN2812964.1 sulfite exporter TauE/SafE family protein [Bacteroidales bacterium]
MEPTFSFLAGTALTIGFLHTVAGPDHYLPFVAMAKTRNWSVARTINIVILCGLGHVLSSIVIGFIGIAAGIAISGIEHVEGFRGNLAAWLLFIFGLAYMGWGIIRLLNRKNHHHHPAADANKKMTFWILFAIFVFGPCEPLIPILMYPAAEHNYGAVAIISSLFALITIATMVIMVLLLLKGISFVKLSALEKYQHVIAGVAIALCGAAILFLGL